jgi:hypothetical protein
MNILKSLLNWFGKGSPRKPNITFTDSADGNGMTYDQAMQDARDGWKVRMIDWHPLWFVFADGERLLMTFDGGKYALPCFPVDADRTACNWVRCGRIE